MMLHGRLPLPTLRILHAMPLYDRVSGRHLRRTLNRGVPWWKFWRRWSGPAFYAAMARLEDAGLVEGDYCETMVPGLAEIVAERTYVVTWAGCQVASETPVEL